MLQVAAKAAEVAGEVNDWVEACTEARKDVGARLEKVQAAMDGLVRVLGVRGGAAELLEVLPDSQARLGGNERGGIKPYSSQ